MELGYKVLMQGVLLPPVAAATSPLAKANGAWVSAFSKGWINAQSKASLVLREVSTLTQEALTEGVTSFYSKGR